MRVPLSCLSACWSQRRVRCLLFVGLVGLALARSVGACPDAAPPPPSSDFWLQAKAVLDPIQSLFTIAAIVATGGWAYYHYFRGRTYRPRLKPSIEGRICLGSGSPFVVVRARVENVGLSRVTLRSTGSGVRISVLGEGGSFDRGSEPWVKEVFSKHGWVEPGEAIEEEAVYSLVRAARAVKLELRLVSESHFEWSAARILIPNESAAVETGDPPEDGHDKEAKA